MICLYIFTMLIAYDLTLHFHYVDRIWFDLTFSLCWSHMIWLYIFTMLIAYDLTLHFRYVDRIWNWGMFDFTKILKIEANGRACIWLGNENTFRQCKCGLFLSFFFFLFFCPFNALITIYFSFTYVQNRLNVNNWGPHYAIIRQRTFKMS